MVSGEIGPEQVSGTVECAGTRRTAAAASFRCSLGEGAAGCSLAGCSIGGRALADGLVVPGGFAVAVFAGLAAAALLIAADAAGAAASPMSATVAIAMPARRPRMPRLVRPPPTKLCGPAPLALHFVARMTP